MHIKEISPQNKDMKTSTKIFIVLSIAFFVANIFLTNYLLRAIVPTGNGFVFKFDTLAWISLASQVLFNIFFNILFFRFLKEQKLTNAIFFSVLPLTIAYGAFMVYIVSVKNMNGVTAQSVRATLNIATEQNANNNLLWAALATLVYLSLLFIILFFTCKPLTNVEKITEKLGDGRSKYEDFKVGGGKQFKKIENSLNKINYNIKEKDNKIRQTNLQMQKSLPKQFFKFLGKNSVKELEIGNQVSKKATVLFCDLKNSSKNPTLEDNFNYVNSFLKTVAPLIRRYEGFVDKYLGNGVLCVFSHPQDAINCAHAILRAIEAKNKSQKSHTDAKIAIHTGEIVFGIVGDEQQKSPTIVSDALSLCEKINEINEFIGTKLLISGRALNELPQKYDFDYRYTGDLGLQNGNLALFESLEYHSKDKKVKLKKLKNKFERGVRAYNDSQFEEAKENFEYVLKFVSDDTPSYVYFNKATDKMKEPA